MLSDANIKAIRNEVDKYWAEELRTNNKFFMIWLEVKRVGIS